jgi:hypothetical protein
MLLQIEMTPRPAGARSMLPVVTQVAHRRNIVVEAQCWWLSEKIFSRSCESERSHWSNEGAAIIIQG